MTRAKRKRSFAPRPLPKVRTPEEIEQRNLEKRKKRRKKERLKVCMPLKLLFRSIYWVLGEKRMAGD